MKSSSQNSVPRKTWVMFALALICLALAIFTAQWQIRAQNERSRIRQTGQRVTAVAMTRHDIEFNSTKGPIRATPIVGPLQGTLKKYDSVVVIYDRNNPKRVVLEQDDAAFNITIWVIFTKLFVASIVFGILGFRKTAKFSRVSTG